MPVRILYNDMKDTPVPLIADKYIKTIVPSIVEKDSYLEMIKPLRYDYKKTNTEEKCIFDKWINVENNLCFTKGYNQIFKENQIVGLWIAYESLVRIFEKYPGPDFYAGYMQCFSYKRKKFWVTAENNHIVFSTPSEY